MSFTVTGFLKERQDAVQVTEKLLTRLFVIEKPSDKYPEIYAFQLINDRCDLIEPFQDGDEIEVSFNISCRAWQNKYFTNLNAWKIQPAGTTSKEPKSKKVDADIPDTDDTLPF